MFEGEGSATLMSANYPAGFPEDELMTWQFVIPAPLRASVSFLQFNVSNCVPLCCFPLFLCIAR